MRRQFDRRFRLPRANASNGGWRFLSSHAVTLPRVRPRKVSPPLRRGSTAGAGPLRRRRGTSPTYRAGRPRETARGLLTMYSASVRTVSLLRVRGHRK